MATVIKLHFTNHFMLINILFYTDLYYTYLLLLWLLCNQKLRVFIFILYFFMLFFLSRVVCSIEMLCLIIIKTTNFYIYDTYPQITIFLTK